MAQIITGVTEWRSDRVRRTERKIAEFYGRQVLARVERRRAVTAGQSSL